MKLFDFTIDENKKKFAAYCGLLLDHVLEIHEKEKIKTKILGEHEKRKEMMKLKGRSSDPKTSGRKRSSRSL